MLTIDEKTYKKIASNLSKEVNQITGEKTISSSKALEILAQSFGYKNYNSILPMLSKESSNVINIYNSKEDLVSNGFKDIMIDVKPDYLSRLSDETIRDIQKNYQVKLFHFFKAAFLTPEDKFYMDIPISKLQEYYKNSALLRGLKIEDYVPSARNLKRDINFLQLTLGVVFRAIMKNENSNLILYVNKKELFNFDFIDDGRENRNFFLKFSNGKRENRGKITGENDLFFFTEDENGEKQIEKFYETNMVFFNTYDELIISNRLIGDWTNKRINHFFELSKDGLIRAKYITRYYPYVSSFISSNIYGYMDDKV